MKSVICILLIVLLSIFSVSCAKKPDKKETHIDFDASIKSENDTAGDIAGDNNAADDQQPSQQNEIAENDGSEPLAPNNSEDEVQPDKETANDIESNESEYKSPQIDAPNPRIYGYLVNIENNLHGAPITVNYNGLIYYHYSSDGFPKHTIYENVDLSQLKPTGEKVTIERCSSGPTDNSIIHTEQGELCDLPADMKNDPYVKMLAIKRANGKTVLFFNADGPMNTNFPEHDTLYRIFLKSNRVSGSECLAAESVDAALLSYCEYPSRSITKQVTVEGKNAQELYDRLIKFEVSDDDVSKEFQGGSFGVYISFRFKDGTSFLPFEYRGDLGTFEGFKPIDGFEEYLLSLLNN